MPAAPFAFTRTDTAAELLIYGDIGDSWGAGESVAARHVVDQLAALGASTAVTVRINSYGGSVADGLAIYNALRAHGGRVEVRIDAIAASIASLIAMAGDDIAMLPASAMMIHAPWVGSAGGNATALRNVADTLDAHGEMMAAAYARRAGLALADVRALLDDGADHWFTAEQAVAAGFADRIVDPDHRAACHPHVLAGLHRYLTRAPAPIAAALRTLTGGFTMPTETQPVLKKKKKSPSASPSAFSLAAELDTARRRLDEFDQQRAMIHSALQHHGDDPDVRRLTARLCSGDFNAREFGVELMRTLGSRAAPLGASAPMEPTLPGYGGPRVTGGAPVHGADFLAAASDGLLLRAGIRPDKPHPAAGDFRQQSVLEIARLCVARSGRRDFGMDRPDTIIRAAMSTSDFPMILEGALRAAIRVGMEGTSDSHRLWCKVSEAVDLKPQSRVLLSSAPDLEQVAELGEYQHGAFTEDAASLQPVKFGRIIALSWESLVNDNLGAFLGIGPALGRAALRREADVIYGLLLDNGGDGVDMQDGKELFHNDHSNTATYAPGSYLPLNAAGLSAARAKLRRQTSVGGAALNLTPSTLIVAPERESEAEILVASATVHTGQAASESATPGWLGALQVVTDPRLSSANVAYVVASPNEVDCAEVTVLTGHPELSEEDAFDSDAKRWKLRHVFGAAFLDWRGIVRLTLTESG